MAKLMSMTYEEARAEHFKTLKDEAKRKMIYWATRVRRCSPNDLNDPAHIKASEYGAEYSYYKDALEALAAQPKWISVEERLPEPYHRYIVVIKLKYAWETEWERVVDVACMVPEGGYIEGQWDTFNDWDEGQEIHVTHWMPLPSTEGIE